MIVPTQIVAFSLAAGVSTSCFLVALSRGPLLIRDLRARFRVSCLLTAVIWIGLILSSDEFWRLDSKAIGDVVAGFLIISAFMLTTFIVWLLLALGISTSLLVSLSARQGPVDLDAWLADYGIGFGIRDVFRDRLSVILRSGAATVSQSNIVLARSAHLTVGLLGAAMWYFNFPQSTDR